MKCEACNGRGQRYKEGYGFRKCGVCHGSGEVKFGGEPMTEQEYLQNCDTEELAELLLVAIMSDVLYGKILPCRTHEDAVKVVREWLKQPHKDTK